MGAVGVEGRCCRWHGGVPVRLTKRTGARGGRAVATLAMKIFFFKFGQRFLEFISWTADFQKTFVGQPISKLVLPENVYFFFIKSCFCFPTRRF